jgi:Raf kinase inhibitor-like YbhB/YbcL family protein
MAQEDVAGDTTPPMLAACDVASKLALARLAARDEARLEVTSIAFAAGEAIPLKYSAYGEGLSPPLAWMAGPKDTQSYVLILEDPDAPMARPFVHWIAFNIPPEATSLPAGLPPTESLATPEGMKQGRNSLGKPGYFGPRPPIGDPHHYHFEIFALDRMLDTKSGEALEALVSAMENHVLAKGELVGTYAQAKAPAR